MEQKIPMTKRGYDKLSTELKHLKSVERPNVIKAIASARELGDLSENAEYHAAREKQGFIEGRILSLESKVNRADVIDVTKLDGDTIKFGATIILIDEDTEEEQKYQVVGSDEADIKNGLLPITSPLAKALIGKASGDTVEVTTPGGSKSYSVEGIKFV